MFDPFSMRATSLVQTVDEGAFFSDFREAFHVVVAFSVFTHFDLTMASRYLGLLRGVIKSTGHLFLTWFVDHPVNPMGSRLSPGENFRDRDGGLVFTIFSPTTIAELAASAGLFIERVSYGNWRGWPPDALRGHHAQDIVILRRDGPFSECDSTRRKKRC
jgi:hypothetical protein